MKSDWVVLQGFHFEHCGGHMLLLENACHNRVTGCRFMWCGNPRWTFVCAVLVGHRSHSNRVDHCYWVGSKATSLALRVSHRQEDVASHNRFDHNVFRDIIRLYGNGQKAVQLGSGGYSCKNADRTIVEYNTFDNASGDSEIVSNEANC